VQSLSVIALVILLLWGIIMSGDNELNLWLSVLSETASKADAAAGAGKNAATASQGAVPQSSAPVSIPSAAVAVQEDKAKKPKSGLDFSKGSDIIIVNFPNDIGAKLEVCHEIQKSRNKKFAFEDLIYDPTLAKDASIVLQKRDAVLEDDLSERIRQFAGSESISVPLRAKFKDSGEQFIVTMPIPSGEKSSEADLLKKAKRFRQEGYLLSLLDNPYIDKAIGIVAKRTDKGIVPFIGMARQDVKNAVPLDHILYKAHNTGYRFDVAEVIALAQPIANALRTIHNDSKDESRFYDPKRVSLVHRNLNPKIVFTNSAGDERVFDFGLAKLISHQEEVKMGGEQTKIGTPVGEVRYYSWEQACGTDSRKLTPATDLYSLTVIMYELMTGKSPYKGNDEQEIRSQVLLNDFIKISAVGDKDVWGQKIFDVLDSGMLMNPNNRLPAVMIKDKEYRHAARIEETLKEYAEKRPVPALLDGVGNYSEDAAQNVRIALFNKLK